MADSENIIQLGIEAARAGNKAEARDLFRLVTREDPGNAQGWLWLAGVAEDREEKRAALEHAVQIDPNNELARKGLQALGGSTGRLAATAPTPTPPPAPTPPPVTTPPPTSARSTPPPPAAGMDEDLDFADSLNTLGFYEQAESGTANTARTYESGGDDAWAPPDFGEDNFDLSDYQNRPRVSIEDVEAMEREEASRIVVEDEGRRRGLPRWLFPLIGLLLLLIVVFTFVLPRFRDDNTVVLPPNTTPAASAVAGNPNAGATSAATADPFDTSVLDPSGAAPSATIADNTPPTALPDGSQPTAPAVDGVPTVAPDNTTIVIQPGPTTPADAPTALPEIQPTAPPVVEPAVPTAPPAAGADVSTANPAIVPNAQRIVAGNWNFVWDYGYGPLQTIGTGSYGGVAPSRGQWLAITMAAGNTGGQPVAMPDGLFVLKDAQNRVYDYNRAASIDWLNRLGRGIAADVSAGDLIGGESVSFVLLFDVPADATNLVLFSRDNPTQGYLVR